MQHFVVIRMGIGVHSEDWYRSALGLFEAITFPSLCAQTSQHFIALVLVDHAIPQTARRHLEHITAGNPNFHVLPIDLTRMYSVRQGCFDYVWDRCHDYLLGRRIIVDPFDYVITSVLDADDAWHRDTVAIVRAHSLERLPAFQRQERENPTCIRHTGGMCLSFPHGLRWFAHSDVVLPAHLPFNSMSVFTVARFSSGISAWSSRHTQWTSYCNVLEFAAITAEADRPMWAYVRHDRTQVGWDEQGNASDPRCVESLRYDFGIDFARVEQWRTDSQRQRGGDQPPRSHLGMPSTEQLDCYFRITALNRQIDVLERQAEEEDLDAAGKALLLRQRAARDDLMQIFREQARSIFR
jgi:hypothetical protein